MRGQVKRRKGHTKHIQVAEVQVHGETLLLKAVPAFRFACES